MNRVLPCVEIDDPPGVDAAVVWLHGLGASGHDFEPIVPVLQAAGCNRIRFVFPHAPTLAVTINGGMVMPAWYDITALDRDHGRENAQHVRDSAQQVDALIERENDRGIASERIVIAGFSQGGAMALHVGPRAKTRLAGIMCLSAYQVLPTTFEHERQDANRSTPSFFGHGTHDPLVPETWGKRAYDVLNTWGEGAAQWHTYPMAHEVCQAEIADIAGWLRAILPPIPA